MGPSHTGHFEGKVAAFEFLHWKCCCLWWLSGQGCVGKVQDKLGHCGLNLLRVSGEAGGRLRSAFCDWHLSGDWVGWSGSFWRRTPCGRERRSWFWIRRGLRQRRATIPGPQQACERVEGITWSPLKTLNREGYLMTPEWCTAPLRWGRYLLWGDQSAQPPWMIIEEAVITKLQSNLKYHWISESQFLQRFSTCS